MRLKKSLPRSVPLWRDYYWGEQISPKICRADGRAKTRPPFRPPHLSASGGEATLSDLPAGRQVGRFSAYAFSFERTSKFFPAYRQAGLAANSFLIIQILKSF
ncbi:hypothetical protein COZ26_03680 [Candidatus Kuenenbacteria bacterium CG_4_10_14_3_um_filter_39_14]|uniref:Uncharacterized protein n=1 Tax=Candidatus Kuenenbacteria bacterium CG_4_10_14_3_um_filter_39_14 TaxID=1974614 RepID=A0A2M7MG71_9BACT|nr:MAG: hypothetical protein COZ26_03680 [Candidatus Kuenenbacteria bacterium CG_4_10_14_3_um_filter_39_14]